MSFSSQQTDGFIDEDNEADDVDGEGLTYQNKAYDTWGDASSRPGSKRFSSPPLKSQPPPGAEAAPDKQNMGMTEEAAEVLNKPQAAPENVYVRL